MLHRRIVIAHSINGLLNGGIVGVKMVHKGLSQIRHRFVVALHVGQVREFHVIEKVVGHARFDRGHVKGVLLVGGVQIDHRQRMLALALPLVHPPRECREQGGPRVRRPRGHERRFGQGKGVSHLFEIHHHLVFEFHHGFPAPLKVRVHEAQHKCRQIGKVFRGWTRQALGGDRILVAVFVEK